MCACVVVVVCGRVVVCKSVYKPTCRGQLLLLLERSFFPSFYIPSKRTTFMLKQSVNVVDASQPCMIQKPLVAVEPYRPILTNVGTETAFRDDHCKQFQTSEHLLGSEVSWCDHRLAQTPKEAFFKVRVHAGTAQVDLEVEHPPPAVTQTADSPPGDLLIIMAKETVITYQKEFWKMKKWIRRLFVSLIDPIVMKTLLTARLPVVVGLWKEIFARTHTATH